MDLQRIVTILLRRWWLVLGMPALVLAISLVLLSTSPYVASMRATVLIPGDTQETGNAERPELMVLDDVPQLVKSPAFANNVSTELQASAPQYALSTAEIQASLSADYYSRNVTVRATRDSEQEALALATAVQSIFEREINYYLIPEGGAPATVRIIETPTLSRDSPATGSVAIIIQTLVALVIGCGLAALAAAFDQRIHSRSDLAMVLPVPVLGDLLPVAGAARGRWRHRRRSLSSSLVEDRADASSPAPLLDGDEPVRALRATLEATGPGPTDRGGTGGQVLILAGVDRDDRAVPAIGQRLGTVCAAAGERCLVIDCLTGSAQPEAPSAFAQWLGGAHETPAPLPVPNDAGSIQVLRIPVGSGGRRDVMRGPRWDRALSDARTAYDVTLIAVRPIAVSADALALARHVDGAVFLVRAGRTSGSALVQARAAFQAAGGAVIGTVLIPADEDD